MNLDKLKAEIISYSKTIGIDKIGFTTADPFLELKDRLIKQQQLNYQSGFEEPNIDKRVYPELIFQEPRSIIAIALAYPSRMTNPPKGRQGERRGLFARASWGLDYHLILQERLKKLEQYIIERIPNARLQSMTDTGALSDRAVAERAGIGWSGKNCAIITEEFGSYIYLGEMITNIPFEPDERIENQCGNCTKCLDACPTGALVQGGQINAQRCLSYISQTKLIVPEEFRERLGNRLYGCDSCQTSCPKNRRINFHLHEEMELDGEVIKPLLKPILQMSNRQFKEQFGHLAGSWRGRKPIQRNAIIALGNFKDHSASDELIELLKNDPRPEIRATAAWALGKIEEETIIIVLKEQLEIEENKDVLLEIEKVLKIAD